MAYNSSYTGAQIDSAIKKSTSLNVDTDDKGVLYAEICTSGTDNDTYLDLHEGQIELKDGEYEYGFTYEHDGTNGTITLSADAISLAGATKIGGGTAINGIKIGTPSGSSDVVLAFKIGTSYYGVTLASMTQAVYNGIKSL